MEWGMPYTLFQIRGPRFSKDLWKSWQKKREEVQIMTFMQG